MHTDGLVRLHISILHVKMNNMTEDEFFADRLSAMAHPGRLAIVRMLVKAGPAGLPAGQLGEPLGIASNALTFHLQKLARAGLVRSQRSGQFIIYTAIFEAMHDLTDYLLVACCAASPDKCSPQCATADTVSNAHSLPFQGAQDND